MGVSLVLIAAARSAVAWSAALLLQTRIVCCYRVGLAPCYMLCALVLCCLWSTSGRRQSKLASASRVPDDLSLQAQAVKGKLNRAGLITLQAQP